MKSPRPWYSVNANGCMLAGLTVFGFALLLVIAAALVVLAMR